jgi:hypothetical protein
MISNDFEANGAKSLAHEGQNLSPVAILVHSGATDSHRPPLLIRSRNYRGRIMMPELKA